ncbi:MAG: hypothetical protein EB119_10655 [Synechococcaceae bacterium WBB_34_004]|nr:hypothetical protein [Synechococcaceae bacterium WBB_34_004]
MSLTLSETERAERKPIEAGSHRAVLYSVVEIGTHKNVFADQEKWQRKGRFTFECSDLTSEFEVVENGKTTKVEKPLVISTEQTLSLGEKSNLRKLLEGWRGQAFTSAELKEFSLKNLLGKPALINVVHKMSKQGRTYAAITSISKLPRGMKAPKPFNEPIYYEIEEGEGGAFSHLPEWLQEKIRASKEFAEAKPAKAAAIQDNDEDTDSVPF